MTRYALLSVSDRSGLDALAAGLVELGFRLLSSSGTAAWLRAKGLPVTDVSALTGFPEILDGRVKTLHPLIHAGILADRERTDHLQTLEEHGVSRIDLVAVNLYPFAQTVAREGVTSQEIIENIDIGGPALIRAAAKNHRGVIVLTAPEDYAAVLEELKKHGDLPQEWRRELARKAFADVSAYDARIAAYFASSAEKGEQQPSFPAFYSLGGELVAPLRYGENPHQAGAFYSSGQSGWQVLHGKEPSFNNLLDIDATLKALRLFAEPTAVITKHCVPCGIGSAETLKAAYDKALAADTQSPFGGVVGLNRPLDAETAALIDAVFTEIIIAPEFAAGAREFLARKKNRRLVQYDPALFSGNAAPWELRQLRRGFLLQTWDEVEEDPAAWRTVTRRQTTEAESRALLFAWKVVSLLRSNAIAITGEDRVFGLGSGQTSRIDSTQLAIWKANKFGHALSNAVCASDGFFPFPDSVEELHRHGVRAIIQPGGSKGDQEVVRACDELGVAMVFTGVRHFRH